MLDNDLRLIPISHLMKGGRWRMEAMRSYSTDQLLWITKGQGRMTVGGVTRGFGPNNAVFIPAGTMHAFALGMPIYGSALFFPRNHSYVVPDKPIHLRIREAVDQGEMAGLIDNLQRELDGDRAGRERAIDYVAGAISVWFERQMLVNDDALAATDASRKLSRRFANLVEANFATDMSVSDYAKMLGVTSTHLTRVCNQTCGTSASDILADRKFAEARRLLADTKVPVQEIAKALGFHSPAYFSRAFHGRTGKSPIRFRKDG